MIKLARKEDIERIQELGFMLNSNFSHTYNIDQYLENNNYIILVNKDINVNAFMIVYKNMDYYEIEAIVVDEEYRKKGIASNLLKYFIDKIAQKNDTILLEVAANNKNAITLYEKFQFEIIGRRKKYYKNIDAHVMKKVI